MVAMGGSEPARRLDVVGAVNGHGLTVHVTYDDRFDRERCVRELASIGIRQPLPHRASWLDITYAHRTMFLCVRDRAGRARFGMGVDIHDVRVPPGHHVWRVRRLGRAPDQSLLDASLITLADMAREQRHLLRLEIQLFDSDLDADGRTANVLEALDFRRNPKPLMYERTVAVDLRPEPETILASFHRTARQNIRGPAKKGLVLAPITDVGQAERLDDLGRKTFARTGGVYQPQEWERIIELAQRRPDDARLIGLFRTDHTGPRALLAYAAAYAHGDHVEYAGAASARPPDLKVSLGYAPAWDLIQWARRTGARWFDFGGITAGTTNDKKDRCGGISDFKRMFSTRTVRCSEEWIWERSQIRGKVVGFVRRGARALLQL